MLLVYNKRMVTRNQSLCLAMIVKNEARIIERCLDSVLPIVDYVSVCDTGSTDSTSDIIQSWCERNGINGIVHHEPFKNFGYNRSRSVKLAQKTFPKSTYLLLLDADMTLEIGPHFNRHQLTHDVYQIAQYDGAVKYYNIRLLRTSGRWECVGVTHEYWDVAQGRGGIQSVNLDSLLINDMGDGGSKSDKFIRDRRMLTEAFHDATTPDYLKTRYSFYLAQTHFDLGDFDAAIPWYQERIRREGWVEEVFYSLYKIGKCHECKGDMENAVSAYTRAWEYRPCRAEPLYSLSLLFRNKVCFDKALSYALEGKKIALPTDILFVEYPIYYYLFDYEISLCAPLVEGMKDQGKIAWENLYSMIDELPYAIAAAVIANGPIYRETDIFIEQHESVDDSS